MKIIERQTRRHLCEVLEKEFEEDVREDELLEDSDDENGLLRLSRIFTIPESKHHSVLCHMQLYI